MSTTTAVTPADVALLRLVAQRLVGPPAATPAEAVAWMTAVQAQDDAGALTSVALRTAGGTRAAVEAAFDAGLIVRSWPMRGTLHTVLAADLVWMLTLMADRPRAAAARRRHDLGLDEEDCAQAERLARAALAGSGGLTRGELLSCWESSGLAAAGGRGYHLIVELAHRGVLCLGPRRGREHMFVLVEEWIAEPRLPGREEALAELALRYLRSHGPATAKDLARWCGLPLTDVRTGIAAGRHRLQRVEVDGVEHLLDPGTAELLETHRARAGGVLLAPGFDEILLGYADRTATLPAEHAARVVPGGNGVFRPTVLSGGRVVGTWRWVGTGRSRRVEATPFTAFTDEVAAVIPDVATRLP